MRVALFGVLVLLSAAAPADMTVQAFLAKADALRAKGLLAAMSPDIGVLRDEIAKASAAYRGKLDTDARAGRQPSSCPPPKGTAKLSSDELLTAFRAIPPKQQTMSVKVAFANYMTKRFPCPH